MTASTWTGASEGLRLGARLLTFQGYLLSATTMSFVRAPTSLGVLGVARTQGGADFLVALRDDEALWIGLQHAKDVELNASLRDETVQALSVLSGALDLVPGIPQPDGRYSPLARSTTSSIDVVASGVRARVVLVDPETYFEQTTCVSHAPLEAANGYGGWHLP